MKSQEEFTLLGGLSPAEFLRDYWQKKPLLIRRAIPAFDDPLTPEELAGLACEADIESRLILEKGGEQPWQVRHGPFMEEDFLTLADDYWTLLVQDVEKHLPGLSAMLEPFRFIPDWRIDDLMISYAAPQGSVGPHWDEYDVFLLQGQGKRRWQINTDPVTGEDFLSDTELRILKHFSAQQEWVLEAGDMLYLPPRVAHYGVALEPCLTYSIGFRAPAKQELFEGFIEFFNEQMPSPGRYVDPDLVLQDNPGQVSAAALEQVKDAFLQNLQNLQTGCTDLMPRWFGGFITEPKLAFVTEPLPEPLDLAGLQQCMAAGSVLERNPGSRFAYIEHADGRNSLFIDGREFILSAPNAWLAPVICSRRTFQQDDLTALLHGPDKYLQQWLLELVNTGYLVIYENE
jgi:50S ribosomal protein L16 3-hydroxylase